jgi:chromatin remodeling complex protein RSC6
MLDDPSKYFKILEVPSCASIEEVRAAYRMLVKVWHPDRFPNDNVLRETATERLKSINEAYEFLTNYFALPPSEASHSYKSSAGSEDTQRTPSAAFMQPVTPDEKLAKVVGDKPLPRTELTKKLWAYIRKNGLQDKEVRTNINADAALQAVFNGKKQVSLFEMTKLVSGHVK